LFKYLIKNLKTKKHYERTKYHLIFLSLDIYLLATHHSEIDNKKSSTVTVLQFPYPEQPSVDLQAAEYSGILLGGLVA